MATQIQAHIFVDFDAERLLRRGGTRKRHAIFETYIGAGSDGSSADKLSLDLKFNPRDTAITFRSEWRALCKTAFEQYDPLEPWNIEQGSVWLADVKTFPYRPMQCLIEVDPYTFHQDSGQPLCFFELPRPLGDPPLQM